MLAIKKRGPGRVAVAVAVATALLLTACQPPGPRALLKGERLIRQGRYLEAVSQLETATHLLPRHAQAWNHLGLAYHGAGQLDRAQRAYQKSLALDLKLASAHFNLGVLYLDLNNLPGAVNELTSYTMLESTAPDGWLKLGAAELRGRRLDAAEKCFKTALELRPRDAEALNGLGLILAQRRRTQDALDRFIAAIHAQPNYAPALLNAAVTHQALNNRPAALEKYRQYLALNPRPSNWEIVDATARALETEMTPASSRPVATRPATQAVTVAAMPALPTNSVFRLVTNRPAAAATAAAASNPAPRVAAATNTPHPVSVATLNTNLPRSTASPPVPLPTQAVVVAVKPTPPVAAEPEKRAEAPREKPPELEVTALREPVAIKLAQDTPAPLVVETSTNPAPPALASTEPGESGPGTENPRAPKRNFLDRINPFKGKPRPATNHLVVTPLPGSPPVQPTEPPPELSAAATSRARPAAIASSAGTPAFARYPYRSPAPPAPGDRDVAGKLLLLGFKAHQAGKPAQAANYYLSAAQADPSSFDAYYNLGLALYEIGRLGESLPAYETALALKPESAEGRHNFALALKRANYSVDAAHELEKVLAQNPSDAGAHLTLANLCAQQLGDLNRAREHYLKLLELDPRHAEAQRIRFWIAAHPPAAPENRPAP
jgi:tetratricopeptide (TPR) repeat protein